LTRRTIFLFRLVMKCPFTKSKMIPAEKRSVAIPTNPISSVMNASTKNTMCWSGSVSGRIERIRQSIAQIELIVASTYFVYGITEINWYFVVRFITVAMTSTIKPKKYIIRAGVKNFFISIKDYITIFLKTKSNDVKMIQISNF